MGDEAPDVRAAEASDPGVRPRRGTIARYATGSLGTGGFATLPGLVLTRQEVDAPAAAGAVGAGS